MRVIPPHEYPTADDCLDAVIAWHVVRVARVHGTWYAVAKVIGRSRKTLWEWRKAWGLDPILMREENGMAERQAVMREWKACRESGYVKKYDVNLWDTAEDLEARDDVPETVPVRPRLELVNPAVLRSEIDRLRGCVYAIARAIRNDCEHIRNRLHRDTVVARTAMIETRVERLEEIAAPREDEQAKVAA
jgi:hypothetical protein